MNSKASFIRLILSVCILTTASYANAQQFTLEDIPLSWKDFEVKEGFAKHPYSAKIYTLSPYRSRFRNEGNNTLITFEAEVKTDTEKSWVKKEFWDKATKEEKQALLNHEKGHLIIAIIHHRKFLQALKGFHFTKQQLRFQIDSIAKSIYAQSDAMNVLYDNETNHMLITEKQQEWIGKLLKELNELYANEKKLVMKQELETTL